MFVHIDMHVSNMVSSTVNTVASFTKRRFSASLKQAIFSFWRKGLDVFSTKCALLIIELSGLSWFYDTCILISLENLMISINIALLFSIRWEGCTRYLP